jgi:hypothetical protein
MHILPERNARMQLARRSSINFILSLFVLASNACGQNSYQRRATEIVTKLSPGILVGARLSASLY